MPNLCWAGSQAPGIEVQATAELSRILFCAQGSVRKEGVKIRKRPAVIKKSWFSPVKTALCA